ncbi:hypothetical protein COX93_01370 [Candidatus Nomurabacteria bacterium CG_4_10_14_0_2_um_filter_30_12]|uniref:Squalene cyclase C-terminal domain-containing protein n=2 Tax=Candidatus Nomuraibacteriota TaxID=1752729 RepID=A0A2J0MNR4_9BACT|nr:MAG: hypothetical protein COU48_01840 [Candidatus Nomurabacteria bacterium CG10_big_fil_rev_8_21_14_0_10_03_31_7]PIZ87360.1 MAG: hypothetical protein COX93_01370 [Candidatus Nomurabacteria bacterium CG_4_10_14_0_2_um_filter_30_12]
MKIKNIFITLLLSIILLTTITNSTKADATDINLTIRDGDTIVFSSIVPLNISEIISINDFTGNPHDIDSKSVLSLINDADTLSTDFNISDLEYYDSFGSLYLKCITDIVGNQCDNWQYTINNIYPETGMDSTILTGGENVYLYFGPQHKTTLNSNEIKTNEDLIVSTEDYDYQNNSWIKRTGVIIGITQPDPNNPWSPIEILTNIVDGNGKATFSLIPEGLYNVGIKEDFYFPTETLTVTKSPEPIIMIGGGGSVSSGGSYYVPLPVIKPDTKKEFDFKKAFDFLILKQKENGSFGEDIYTDWTAISIASKENQDIKTTSIIKLIKYFEEFKTLSTFLTDFERHTMALMSLGLNPYNTNGENYIKKIVDNFDGKQFGDLEKDNDDIFALIVLNNSGYTKEEDIINNTITFILSKQKENGSWDESVDMTSAAIQALSLYQPNEEINIALARAKEFLKQNQKDDGGFGNIFSTAWTIQGILALSEKPEEWIKNNNTPIDYLIKNQDITDIEKNSSTEENINIKNKIWETAYVVTALSNKTWNQIMQKFEKPINTIIVEEKNVLEEKINKVSKTPTQKTKKIANQNISTAISAFDNTKIINNQTIKKNWFKKLLENIFGNL